MVNATQALNIHVDNSFPLCFPSEVENGVYEVVEWRPQHAAVDTKTVTVTDVWFDRFMYCNETLFIF